MSAHDALDQDPSGLLSDAALLALQLHHQPFGPQVPDSSAPGEAETDPLAEPFSDSVTEEQLADIKQALITGDDLLLIMGEKGSGKTTLCQQLSANSGLRIQCFSVTGSERFSTLNLFAGMLEAFQRTPPQKLKDILDELTPCLQSMAARNTLSVIVLDDAHKVSQTELTQLLSGMLYMNSQDETLVRIALATTSDFEDLIPDLLPEGADMPYSSLTIEGFSPPRAAAYLDYRLRLAGFDQEFPFTERDMASLVDHSDGRPAELHALTADVLNEKYGRLEQSIPHELLSDAGDGFLSSRKGKFALGAVATVLILGGMLMFLPQGERQNPGSSGELLAVGEQVLSPETQVPELQLINNGEPGRDNLSPSASETSSITDNASAIAVPTGNDTTNQQVADTDSTSDALAPLSDAGNNEAIAEPGTLENQTTVSSLPTDSPSQNSQDNVENAPDSAALNGTELPADVTDPPREPVAAAAPVVPAPPTEQAEQAPQPTDTVSADNTSPEPRSETASAALIDPDLADILESPSWVLVQDENQFTIQMSASRDLPSVQNFLRRNPLPGPNSIFSFEREGEVWYALVHGIFPTFAEAQRAVEAMTDSAQRDQPWIRSIARVKEISRQE